MTKKNTIDYYGFRSEFNQKTINHPIPPKPYLPISILDSNVDETIKHFGPGIDYN